MTFPMPFVVPMSSAPPPPPAATIQFIAGPGSQPSYSSGAYRSTVSIGTAAAGRRVFVAVQWQGTAAAGPTSFASATIGGIAATIHVQRTEAYVYTQNPGAMIISAAVPTGTAAEVALFTDRAAIIRMGVYRVMNLLSATPVHTASGFASAATRSVSINVQESGVLIASDGARANVQATMAGVTRNYSDTDSAARVATAGMLAVTATQTGRTVSVTRSDSGSMTGALVAASFR